VDALGGDSRKAFLKPFLLTEFLNHSRFLHRVLEMEILIVTLVENFEFSLPPQTEKTRIYRKPIGMMVPRVEGQQGAWMGLGIKSLEE
jgi:hypothetical protein